MSIRGALGIVYGTAFIIISTGCASVKVASVTAPDSAQVAAGIRKLYSDAGDTSLGTSTQKNAISPGLFAQEGFTLVDRACDDYFDALIRVDKRLKMTKADVVALGTAAGVIATLAKSTPAWIGITAATFGFATIIIDNVDQYALATPYPTQTRQLIQKARVAFRTSTPPESAVDLTHAADLISGYASLCTYSGIAALSEQAIAKGAPVDTADQPNPMFSSADKSTLQQVDKLIAVSGGTPTDLDYVTLAAMADPATTDAGQLSALKNTLSAAIDATKILSSDGHTKTATLSPTVWTLLQPLMVSNSRFKALVENKKQTSKPGATVDSGALEAVTKASKLMTRRVPLIQVP